jgi:hypothetical protein
MENLVLPKFSFLNLTPLDNGVMEAEFVGIQILSLEHSKEITKGFKEVCPEKKFLMFFFSNHPMDVSRETMSYSASPEGSAYSLAEAYLINSSVQTYLANIYLTVFKPIVPTKMFRNRDKAMHWLLNEALTNGR